MSFTVDENPHAHQLLQLLDLLRHDSNLSETAQPQLWAMIKTPLRRFYIGVIWDPYLRLARLYIWSFDHSVEPQHGCFYQLEVHFLGVVHMGSLICVETPTCRSKLQGCRYLHSSSSNLPPTRCSQPERRYYFLSASYAKQSWTSSANNLAVSSQMWEFPKTRALNVDPQ